VLKMKLMSYSADITNTAKCFSKQRFKLSAFVHIYDKSQIKVIKMLLCTAE